MSATGISSTGLSSTSASPMMVPNIVQLVNEGDTTFNMRYGPTQRLTIAAGERLFVNEEIAWHFLGKWWTDNANPRVRERREEYSRLRVLYGAYEDETLWERNRPRIVAYAPDGQRITSVVDSPDGEASGITQLGREMSLETQMKTMQDMVLNLQAQLDGRVLDDTNRAQPAVPADATPQIPPNPTMAPQRDTATIAGTQIPVTPPPFPTSEPMIPGAVDETVDEEGAPPRMPVRSVTEYDPTETDVEEDAPQITPNGPARTGGRVATGQ